jgi:hypothetical protein
MTGNLAHAAAPAGGKLLLGLLERDQSGPLARGREGGEGRGPGIELGNGDGGGLDGRWARGSEGLEGGHVAHRTEAHAQAPAQKMSHEGIPEKNKFKIIFKKVK